MEVKRKNIKNSKVEGKDEIIGEMMMSCGLEIV